MGTELLDPEKLGLLGAMALALAALIRGWVVTAGHHAAEMRRLEEQRDAYKLLAETMRAERDEFKEFALKTADTMELAVRTTEQAVKRK